jgi:hypothetical protein
VENVWQSAAQLGMHPSAKKKKKEKKRKIMENV